MRIQVGKDRISVLAGGALHFFELDEIDDIRLGAMVKDGFPYPSVALASKNKILDEICEGGYTCECYFCETTHLSLKEQLEHLKECQEKKAKCPRPCEECYAVEWVLRE